MKFENLDEVREYLNYEIRKSLEYGNRLLDLMDKYSKDERSLMKLKEMWEKIEARMDFLIGELRRLESFEDVLSVIDEPLPNRRSLGVRKKRR